MRGKVVLITGASSGIGAGTAVHFASRGCLLSLIGRNETRLLETLQACLEAGSKDDQVLHISADLEVDDNLRMIIEKTIEKFGKLDVLINCAGNVYSADFENTNFEDYDRLMNVNVRSAVFLTQFALPHLINSKGSVVNVSGVSSQRPIKNYMVVCMSKAALDQFTRVLALEVATKGVRVNSVNPGAIKTPIFQTEGLSVHYDTFVKRFHAMERGGTVDEVAKAIAFLADDNQSSFVTGVTLFVDGGAYLKGPI